MYPEIFEFYAKKRRDQFRNDFLLDGAKVQKAVDDKVRMEAERKVKHEVKMKMLSEEDK